MKSDEYFSFFYSTSEVLFFFLGGFIALNVLKNRQISISIMLH